MAEVLAIGASVIAIIQITDRIVGLCKHYLTTVKDAPSDLRLILLEASALKVIFENLDFWTACDSGVSNIVSFLAGVDGPIEGCLKSVSQLEKLFPSDWMQHTGQNRSKKQRVKATLAALAWPLKETRARKLLDEISRYKTTITLAVTTESIQDIKEFKAKTVEVHSLLTESQRQEVCRWLQRTDPSSIHFRAQKDYEPGTGSWMLRAPEWSSWLNANERCLWIHGIPGAGKTVLMSYLIERVEQHCSNSQMKTCASVYYYCYFGRNENEAAPFLRWLVNQLCRKADSVPGSVYKLYKRGSEPNFGELLEAVEAILEEFDCIYLEIDALDESIPRDDLLQVLQALATDSRFRKIQLLVSSREYIDIEKVMNGFSVSISMANPSVEEDIRLHVRSTLQVNSKFKRWPQNLLDEVEAAVSTGARGMFRWAVCQIDVLQRLKCEIHNVKKALKNLPKTLDETYDTILLTMPPENLMVVDHIFQWILYHNEMNDGEGIPCEILVQALGKSTAELTVDGLERFYDNDVLRELCGCLIKILPEKLVESSIDFDVTVHRVSFAHYTVREYLDTRCSKDSVVFPSSFQEETRQHVLGTVFSEAHNIELNEQWKDENASIDPTDVLIAVNSSLNIYSVISAILSLLKWPAEISQHEQLCSIAIDLLDPSKPHFGTLRRAASIIEGSISSSTFDDPFFPERRFWNTSWYAETSNMVAVHLYHLLLLAETDEKCLPLAEKFLQGKDARDFFEARLRFERAVWLRGNVDTWILDGSIVEVFAQLVASSDGTNEGPLWLLLDHVAGLSDYSKVLLVYISSHWSNDEDDCQEDCLLRRLLGLGADPNSGGSRITPLQIAVVSGDVAGVRALLDAGADPNDTGSSEGTVWEDGTRMSQFKHLDGASALYICRNFELMQSMYMDLGREKERVRRLQIESLLLRYRATEYQRV